MDYLSIVKNAEQEVVIKKSRFIGLTYTLTSEEEIALCLDDAREKYPNASHYCYGAVIGLDGLLQRFSDDGEPGGTAGMPILQVLLQRELKNVMVIVVRYFGGIKLGAGGLVRAYSRTTAEAINEAGMVRMQLSSRGVLTINYNLLGSVEHFLRQPGIEIEDMSYGEMVSIQLLTKLDWEGLTGKLTDICSGNLEIKRLDSIYRNWEP
ncbi:MAG TPA: YigZ family protein [Clostridiales bacterium]|nr:YigZ family protein [Clostridiales bacterium]